MSNLINREEERDSLRGLVGNGWQLALLFGRRRIGKTYLLNHLWEDPDRVLYFTASGTSPEINRRALLERASEWANQKLRPEDHPTWRTVFRGIFELRSDEPIVIVLDEFQYLASTDDGLEEVASELNAIWEHGVPRDAGLLLVLSGSAVGTMRGLERGGAALHGRLDWRRRLDPFDYFDAGQMVSNYGLKDRVHVYAAFGGTPKYLDAVDDTQPIDENIIDLLLSSNGKVRSQIETALEQEQGLRNIPKYRAILASIGLERRTEGEIAASLGQEKDSSLKRMVKQLVELEYLEEGRNFEAPGNQAYRYRIADPAQRTYYGLVLPNESAIASAGPRAVWEDRLKDQVWPSYVGQQVFEDVVQQAYLRASPLDDLPSIEEWGRWEGLDREKEPVEMDVVSRLLDRSMMTGSIKFQSQQANARVFLDHVEDLRRLARSGQGWAREALDTDSPFIFVSAAGFSESFWTVREEEEMRRVITWSLEDLY